jgi:GT2 family glycosyltransferase
MLCAGIINYGDYEELQACLRGLSRQARGADRILVVDNASVASCLGPIRTQHPRVEYFPQPGNLGYAGGANLIIQQAADCDRVLLLNPDVIPGEDFVGRMEASLDASKGIGAATGKLLQPTDPLRIDSTGLVIRRDRRIQDRGRDEVDRGQYACPGEVFGGSGAAVMLARPMLADVAVDGECFDAEFFAYYEDVDLAWRARLLGWHCAYVPEATGIHRRAFSPATRRRVSRERKRLATRNHLRLLVKNELPSLVARDLAWMVPAEGMRLLRALVLEPYCAPALLEIVRHWRSLRRKRRWVMARRRASVAEMGRWFQ